MRSEVIAAVVLEILAVSVSGQTPRHQFIDVRFAVDGKPTPCGDLKVQLQLGDREIVPQYTSRGFVVPEAFNKKPSVWPADQRVGISVSCGEHKFEFSEHPSWVRSGSWTVGIAYPPYWFEDFRYTGVVEHGAWISYLEFDCDECDPGVISSISHPTPPASLVARLSEEQRSASGEHARDIAYELAVFDIEYQQNRVYLLELLGSCLSKPKESPENDVCDGRLLDYVTNLYWRGDDALLGPLLQIADSRKDVIGDIGTFYADLLDRHASITLRLMQGLPVDKQLTICGIAGSDDLSHDSPKLDRVAKHLKQANDDVAERCLQETERAVGRTAH
jgi:hypothetical protein